MARVPVVCQSCQEFWVADNLVGGDATSLSFTNVTITPCPRCGGTGQVPDGTYSFIGDSIQLLGGPETTIDALRSLAQILTAAREARHSRDEIANEITKQFPEFTRLTDLLPTSRGELYTFLALLVATIALIIQLRRDGSKDQIDSAQPAVVQTIINNVTTEINISTKVITKPKVGRNAPCPCGSGKKFKKCHGSADAAQAVEPDIE